ANKSLSSAVKRGWISHATAIALSRVRERKDRKFPQMAVVYQARSEFKAWLKQYGGTLNDHESWLHAHRVLAPLTWWARGLGDLREYWKFAARDTSYRSLVYAEPVKRAFFGDRRFDVRGVPVVLARRGRFYGSGYLKPEPWDEFLVSKLQELTILDDL